MTKRFMLNSQGDAQLLAQRLKDLGAEVGASVSTRGESRTLTVTSDSAEAMAKVTAALATVGSRIIADYVPDYSSGLAQNATAADDVRPAGTTLH